MDKVIDQLKPEVDCQQVDIEHLETMGASIATDLKDYMLNIDIANSQFDIDAMAE